MLYSSRHMLDGNAMNEIIFLIEEAPEGGYTARALGESIFTEADNLAQMHERARDAVLCHFEASDIPMPIRLHFVKDDQGIFTVTCWTFSNHLVL